MDGRTGGRTAGHREGRMDARRDRALFTYRCTTRLGVLYVYKGYIMKNASTFMKYVLLECEFVYNSYQGYIIISPGTSFRGADGTACHPSVHKHLQLIL